jgi:hypothetical protein
MKMLVYKGLAAMTLATAAPVALIGLPAQAATPAVQAATPAASAASRYSGTSGQYGQGYQDRHDGSWFSRHQAPGRACASTRDTRWRQGWQRRPDQACTPYQRFRNDRSRQPWQRSQPWNTGRPWTGPGNR